MFFANDINENRICAKDAVVGEKYLCPTCNTELILKSGIERLSHFSHKAACTDKWHYEMSEWHQRMQNYFLPKYREVVIEYNNEKHRADVLIPDRHGGKSLVIEFQHSNMSIDEFVERNVFYRNAGYDIIWIFDMNNSDNVYKVSQDYKQSFVWNCPFSCLKELDKYDKKNLPNNIFLSFSKTKRTYSYDILIQLVSYNTIGRIVCVDFDWCGPIEISLNNMARNFVCFKNGKLEYDYTDAAYFFD